jgi:hypothetical protein
MASKFNSNFGGMSPMNNNRVFDNLDSTQKFSSTSSEAPVTPQVFRNDANNRNPSVTSDNFNPLLHNRFKADNLGFDQESFARKSKNFMEHSNVSVEKSDRGLSRRFEASRSKSKDNILN